MHVLLVDDDVALSEMLTEYLAGEGIRTTFSVRPRASVKVSKSFAMRFRTAVLGSSAPVGSMHSATPGRMNRAIVSMWPSVWSFKRPSPSQRKVVTPNAFFSSFSSVA